MKEQFCSYEIALKLKELGFDEECFGVYIETNGEPILRYNLPHLESQGKVNYIYERAILIPLWQQAIDWFREKYKINCIVGYTDDDKEEFMAVIDRPNQDIDYNMNPTESYYEAREQAILKAIELCQNKK